MNIKKSSFLSFISLLSVLSFVYGCSLADNQMYYDRSSEKTAQDYREALAPAPIKKKSDAYIPDMQSYIVTDEISKIDYPLVSISVNQTVSLRDLLFELTDQAGIDLELDPQIRGTLIFTVRQRPLDEVIHRIADMAGLRYNFNDNLLRIELDRPYLHTYNIEFLNFLRTVSSKVKLNVSVISESEATIGSGSTIDTKIITDFWEDLDENLEQVLSSTENYISLATLDDPVAQPRAVETNEQTIDATDPANIPPPILNITAPPNASAPQEPNAPSTFSINKQTGMISVYATERQHKIVSKYLYSVKKSVSTQILVEAKILEVSLKDEFNTGIDWSRINGIDLTGLASLNASFSQPGFSPGIGANNFSLSLTPGSDISVIVEALNRFGTVRALSSPRLTILNNQSGLLNVVENKVFFEFEADVTVATATTPGQTSITTEIRSVPLGVMLNVLPTIDFKTGEITMMLRPTITSLAGEKSDPSLALSLATADAATIAALNLDNLTNLIPELSVQEIDSVVKVQSGETIIMGGLMTDKNVIENIGVPVLSSMPYFGKLFSSHKDIIEKKELVIFIKATIVPAGGLIHEMDKKLYNKLGMDRRPL